MIWDNTMNREAVLSRVGFWGIHFEYREGKVFLSDLPEEECERKMRLKEKAYRTYRRTMSSLLKIKK
ncbi:hypothetical protein JOD82_001966 [Paenibacillus sp. 1182]|uniref:hypothetical protein n=1 Tax=Paenibacillus sp. 1182 TaxID=2806565 RepID=UPI001AE92C1E|nr:hypothetical protein [Paenibacillus sp. 1182]MBP1308946.1 hypothetical protein [Paenibacillus sp. 1182]